MPAARALVAAVTLAALGCGLPCRDGTLLLTVTLGASVAAADTLAFEIRVAGGDPRRSTLMLPPGSHGGTAEVSFSTYPAGKQVLVEVAALAGATIVGTDEVALTAGGTCATASLNLDADCGSLCALTALTPALAADGDTLYLEGTFAGATFATFADHSMVPATLLGSHRARLTMPMGAPSGPLTVTTAGHQLPPLPFRRAGFALGLGGFRAAYEQTDAARAMPSLTTPRVAATSAVVDGWLYLIGGSTSASQNDAQASLERAPINGDGTLGAFQPLLPPTVLLSPRYQHASVVVGHSGTRSLYVVGGTGPGGALNSVERAAIDKNGMLSTFSVVGMMQHKRYDAPAVVIGNWLYVLGGTNAVDIERATIHPDGSLSPFAIVDGVTLTRPRQTRLALVIGEWLYVIGGTNGGMALDSVERAGINGDGSLSPFVPVDGIALAVARETASAVVLGGALYLVGGVGTSGKLDSVERASLGADGTPGLFKLVPGVSLTTPRRDAASALVGSSFYVLGGVSDAGPSISVERASIDAGSTLAALQPSAAVLTAARARHGSVVLGNWLHAIGGSGPTGYLDSVERAPLDGDGRPGAFVPVDGSKLMVGRDAAAVAALGGWLYVLGGRTISGALKSVERAPINGDGSLGAFADAGTSLSTARAGATAAVLGNALYLFGGDSGAGAFNTIESAAFDADGVLGPFTAVTGSMLSVQRTGHSTAVSGTAVCLIGGLNASGGLLASVDRAFFNGSSLGPFGPATGVTLRTARQAARSAVVGGALYVIGGSGLSQGMPIDSVERAPLGLDGTLGSFAGVGSLASARYAPTVAVTGNWLSVIGGSSTSYLGSVEAAPLQ